MVFSLAKTRLPKKRCNKRQARRHSAMVRYLRIGLPVFVAGIFSTYVVMATPPSVDQTFVTQFNQLDTPTEEMRLEKPRFVGEDSAGRIYEVIADAAKRNPNSPDFIALDNPEAFKDLGDQGQEYVKALEGMYSAKDRTIDLRNDVRIQQGIGGDNFLLKTETGKIALDERTFSSDVAVQGESSQGTISARGMTAYRDENKVVFRGAHMRYNAPADEEETEEADISEDTVDEAESGENGSASGDPET